MTATATTEENSLLLMEEFNQLKDREFGETEHAMPWSFQGYRGLQLPGLKCGCRNETEAILILSGDLAKIYVPFVKLAVTHLTRFDLQVTCEAKVANPGLAVTWYEYLKDEIAKGGRTRKIRLIRSETGDTLYVGSRKSPVMLRLYDKSLSLGELQLGHYWRYEVEYKGLAADRAWELFHVKHLDQAFTTNLVWEEFNKRKVRPIWSVSSKETAVEVGAKVSTSSSQMSWLRRCVSPVVVKLLDLGYENEVLAALKLKHMFNRRSK